MMIDEAERPVTYFVEVLGYDCRAIILRDCWLSKQAAP